MVLEECEHVATDIRCALQGIADVVCRCLTVHHCTQCIIKSHLVIKIIEVTLLDERTVNMWLVNLTDEYYSRELLLDLCHSPVPELHRGHLHHVATEAVDTHCSPITENLEHLYPCIRNRREATVACAVVDTVVQLHSVVPVVAAR